MALPNPRKATIRPATATWSSDSRVGGAPFSGFSVSAGIVMPAYLASTSAVVWLGVKSLA